MKKLSFVKLSKKELSHLQVNEKNAFGGFEWQWPPRGDDPFIECGCNCLYANTPGGSSIEANGQTNRGGNLFSPDPEFEEHDPANSGDN